VREISEARIPTCLSVRQVIIVDWEICDWAKKYVTPRGKYEGQ